MKKIMRFLVAFFGSLLAAGSVFAEEAAATGASSPNAGWFAIAAAIAIGLPALGGALGQGRAASAALDGIARNPGASGKIFVPMILGMALIESLVLFGLIMAFMISAKIG